MSGPSGDTTRHAGPAARALRLGLIVLTYSLLTTWWLWPLPAHLADHSAYPSTSVPEVSADYHLITWALAWDTHALTSHPASLFDASIFHPAPRALAFSEHFLGYVPLFAPTYLATGNPVLASNVLLLLTYPLCALATYGLARRFVSPGAAFLAGALFAFCGLRYEKIYHFHVLGTFWVPAALLLTELWLERARTTIAVALAVAVALQMLATFYLGYALVLLYGSYLPLALWHWRARLDRRRIVGLALAIAASVVPVLLASLPYLEMQRLGLVPSARGEESTALYTMDPGITMVQVRRYLASGGVGVVGYALGALALAVGWRRGAYPRLLALLACAVGLVLAHGPRIQVGGVALWSPYQTLFDWLPGFAAIRLPFRFLFVAQLGFALLAGLGAYEVVRRLPRRAEWPLAALALASVLVLGGARAPLELHAQPVGERQPPAYAWLRDNGAGGALLELPMGDTATSGRRMLLGTTHWLPMLDGYSAYPPLSRNYVRRIATRLPGPAALQALVDAVDVAWILVHVDELDAPARRAWTQATPPGLELVLAWGDDLLFAVRQPRRRDLRPLLVSTERTLGGVALAPVPPPCPGRIVAPALAARPTLTPAAPVRLDVRIANESAAPWPGLGFYPRYLVQLQTVFARDGVPVGRPVRTPLWTDVPAGATVVATADVVPPKVPGAYELWIGLVQDGAPLERCGLTPARVAVRVQRTPAAGRGPGA